jgi:hypothetical protein
VTDEGKTEPVWIRRSPSLHGLYLRRHSSKSHALGLVGKLTLGSIYCQIFVIIDSELHPHEGKHRGLLLLSLHTPPTVPNSHSSPLPSSLSNFLTPILRMNDLQGGNPKALAPYFVPMVVPFNVHSPFLGGHT